MIILFYDYISFVRLLFACYFAVARTKVANQNDNNNTTERSCVCVYQKQKSYIPFRSDGI